MIQLGLARISRLLADTPATWKAIHVAGTNGKGSICAYISALLKAGNISCGRFTSPHLINRWDCITINERPVSQRIFEEVEAQVLARDREQEIKASQFEILTATAFAIFEREKVNVGVVEVGLGGREDATNVLRSPLMTVISRIGLDHQKFLGDSLVDIAMHKAGIIKYQSPCVVDGYNTPEVLDVVRETADANDSQLYITPIPAREVNTPFSPWQNLRPTDYSLSEQENLQCACAAVGLVLPKLKKNLMDDFRVRMLPALKNVKFPGRLQTVSLETMTGRAEPVLLDGAHNEQASKRLAEYVDKHIRVRRPNSMIDAMNRKGDRKKAEPSTSKELVRKYETGDAVTWVLALGAGRADWKLLRHLIKPYDNYIVTNFSAVDGMPWVQPTRPAEIVEIIQTNSRIDQTDRLGRLEYDATSSIRAVLQKASDMAAGGRMVVTGSLYMIADVLRALVLANRMAKETSSREELAKRVDEALEARQWADFTVEEMDALRVASRPPLSKPSETMASLMARGRPISVAQMARTPEEGRREAVDFGAIFEKQEQSRLNDRKGKQTNRAPPMFKSKTRRWLQQLDETNVRAFRLESPEAAVEEPTVDTEESSEPSNRVEGRDMKSSKRYRF